ncbi:MAG: hypothetical protein QF842_00495, partial [Candidatus Marinimicrobia bacterium]|nr:hypothetical protein [Candidatus Neomarinimicrobiota bacterium]
MNKDPQVTADLTALAESEDINDWIKAAKDPKCPSELLDKMITNEDFPWGEPEADEFIIIVARNPNTPEEHLTPLGEEDFDSEVHLSLASNPSCPTDLLKDLASRSALLKETVLKNPSYTPKDKAMKVNRLRIKGSGTGLEQKLSAELTENIDKIKQLLTLPDYDKIDAGIELAISLEEPKIFEILLNGCSLESSRPKLNEWMKRLIISSGEIINEPTGYYVFLSLIINAPGDAKIHQSFKLDDIKCLNLTKCYLSALPKNFSKLKNLEKLYLEYNNLGPSIPNEIFKLNNLIGLYLGHNVIETIPDEISALKNLQLLAFGFNLVNKLSEKLSQLKSLKHLDISNNNFGPFPDVSQLKSLINLCCFAYDDDAKPFGCTCSDCKLSDNHKCNEECACCSPCDDQVEIAEEIKKRFEISILSEFVIEGVQCNEQLQTCDNWFNSNG